MGQAKAREVGAGGGPPARWVCRCGVPPVLLATYGPSGTVNIKVRDRYWHVSGCEQVQAICPRCGTEHVLDLSPPADANAEHGSDQQRRANEHDTGRQRRTG